MIPCSRMFKLIWNPVLGLSSNIRPYSRDGFTFSWQPTVRVMNVLVGRRSDFFDAHGRMQRYSRGLARNPGNKYPVKPFTPKSGQFQICTAAPPEILHHTVWRIWLSIAYSDERWLYCQFSLPHLYISLWKAGRIILFNLVSERVEDTNARIVYPV